jgi:hypothetical protein
LSNSSRADWMTPVNLSKRGMRTVHQLHLEAAPDAPPTACQGVEAVICTVSAMPFSYQPGVNDIQTVDHDGAANLIAAAKAAGVQNVSRVSAD